MPPVDYLVEYAAAGLGLGIGLVIGVGVWRLLDRWMDDIDDEHDEHDDDRPLR